MNASISMKHVFLALAVIYLVNPFDLAPGILVDDLVALGMALAPFIKQPAK